MKTSNFCSEFLGNRAKSLGNSLGAGIPFWAKLWKFSEILSICESESLPKSISRIGLEMNTFEANVSKIEFTTELLLRESTELIFCANWLSHGFNV